MKRLFSISVIGLLLLALSSCGTATSLTEKGTYLNYASIHINDSVHVAGQLINLNDSSIAISIDGAYAEYGVQDIKSYECYTAPNPDLMQRNLVRNTARSTSHSGFFVTLTAISLVVTAMLVVGQIL
ncbi:hypothetical protein [Owenweeksia hongkongensis]|uniref:hypothetical protein n=1 Tax=Owenweeksia hongkongensis TaxID=253245 RepID=UPI003A92FB95